MQRFPCTVVWRCAPLLIPLVLVISGCAPGDLPTGPDQAALETETVLRTPPAGVATDIGIPSGAAISLSPRALTKPTLGARALEREQLISARRGGRISLLSNKTFATFRVPPRALEKDTRISMRMLGAGPGVVIRFGPSGLEFRKPCTLTITFPKDGVDVDDLGGYLIEKDGTATPVPCRVTVIGRHVIVTMWISHFSDYAPGDGEDDDAPDDPPPDHDPP